MHPELVDQMGGKGDVGKKQMMLPPGIKLLADATIQWFIDVQKAEYHSDLKPFSSVAAEMKLRGQEYFTGLYEQILQAQKLIQEQFTIQEEQEHKQYVGEASFAVWQSAFEAAKTRLAGVQEGTTFLEMSKPLQEEMGLSWPFMDRVYEVAKKLYEEQKYEEGRLVYQLLRFLQPKVFAYWFGAGRCELSLNKLEEALQMFIVSLTCDPQNPDAFFQMANCYYRMREPECCYKALGYCIQYAKENADYAPLVQRAIRIQESVSSQKKRVA